MNKSKYNAKLMVLLYNTAMFQIISQESHIFCWKWIKFLFGIYILKKSQFFSIQISS